MVKAMVALANGCEEMEATIIIDVLRRADWDVDAVAFEDGLVRCSRDVCIDADKLWEEVDIHDYDLMALPGGLQGTQNLRGRESLISGLEEFAASGKIVGAICAAPLVLQEAGLLAGKSVTCHPGVAEMLTVATRRDDRVIVDGNIVTSQGPGTAMEFALKLIEILEGRGKSEEIAKGLIL